MKKWAALLIALWMMGGCALADISVQLNTNTLAVNSILDFTIESDGASVHRYTLLKEGKKLFSTGEIAYAFGSYLPREAGQYTLQAEALIDGDWEKAQAEFTVTKALDFDIAPLAPAISAGDGMEISVTARGGSGEYRYLYAISLNDQLILSREAPSSLLFVPEQPGHYSLSILITDGKGAFARKEIPFSVSDGPGISWQAAGGKLLAHGGQKAYRIYSPEDWTAAADSDFIRLLRSSGKSGDLMILEIDEETDKHRTGQITLKSGGKSVRMEISQSAGYDVEEELSFTVPQSRLTLDGESHALWLSAEGEKSFAIQSDAPWQARTDTGFIHMAQEGNALHLSLDEWGDGGVRQGLITLENGESTAFLHLYQVAEGEKPAPFVPDTPFPLPPEEDAAFHIFSQCDGSWKDKKYSISTLEISGCAVFALSHALQHLGYTGDEIQPEALAKAYSFALMKDGSGTMNSSLVGHAGDDLHFRTRYDLYKDLPTIRSKMDQGAVYSFGVVSGHIAMIAEKNADGTMFRIVDSAPSATWERIKNARLFIQDGDENFIPVTDPSQIPGIRYYIETESFGGATYWLESSYIARQGVRLIQPQ